MKNFFTRHSAALWPKQGRLHVYAEPSPKLRALVGEYQRALEPVADEHGLGLPPPQFLHFTVQMLWPAVDDVPAERLRKFVEELRGAVSRVAPLTLRIDRPAPSPVAVEMVATPTAGDWGELVTATRTATAHVLGEEALPELASNAHPHMSIGYGIGDGDSEVLARALDSVDAPPGVVDVDEVFLLAVTQHPDLGSFSWKTIATIPLARLAGAGR